MARSVYSEITPEMEALADLCVKNGKIDPELYAKYDVKRGLRDINGNGVLTGLTDISEIRSNRMENGVKIPCEGQLFYRGYSIEDLVRSMPSDHSFGFEVTAYLLLFGELPNKEQLDGFIKQLSFYRTLPTNFVRDIIMKAPSGDMMNTLARSVLTMYSYDDAPDDISIPNVLRQCIQLIAIFPLLSVYGYQAYRHYHDGKSLYIHQPKPELTTAENILRILRSDKQFTLIKSPGSLVVLIQPRIRTDPQITGRVHKQTMNMIRRKGIHLTRYISIRDKCSRLRIPHPKPPLIRSSPKPRFFAHA